MYAGQEDRENLMDMEAMCQMAEIDEVDVE